MTTTESTATQGLNIHVTDSEGGALVCLSGRVSVDSSPELRERLHALLNRQSLPTLTIDLSDLTYIDCSGIATLVEALRIAHSRKTQLQLTGLHDGPRRLLEVTGLVRLFETSEQTSDFAASKVS